MYDLQGILLKPGRLKLEEEPQSCFNVKTTQEDKGERWLKKMRVKPKTRRTQAAQVLSSEGNKDNKRTKLVINQRQALLEGEAKQRKAIGIQISLSLSLLFGFGGIKTITITGGGMEI